MSVNRNMSILIVDDHKTMRRIVRNLLAQLGLENVEEAADGQEALHQLAKKKYDLILSDWNMMPMTGLELLRIVRKDPSFLHQNVPFIMITAEVRADNVMEAKALGVDGYIAKPFDAPKLESQIASVLQRRMAAHG